MSELPTAELRAQVHAVLDPIWENYIEGGGYKGKRLSRLQNGMHKEAGKVARERVYCWLAEQMWLTLDECHVTKFTTEQCIAAIGHLENITYAEIRAWAHRRDHKTNAQLRASAKARRVLA